MERNYQFKDDHIEFHATLDTSLSTFHNKVWLYPLTFDQLKNMVKRIGFCDIKFYNGFSQSEYNVKESFALVGVFSKLGS